MGATQSNLRTLTMDSNGNVQIKPLKELDPIEKEKKKANPNPNALILTQNCIRKVYELEMAAQGINIKCQEESTLKAELVPEKKVKMDNNPEIIHKASQVTDPEPVTSQREETKKTITIHNPEISGGTERFPKNPIKGREMPA